jgi:hypothetical protein
VTWQHGFIERPMTQCTEAHSKGESDSAATLCKKTSPDVKNCNEKCELLFSNDCRLKTHFSAGVIPTSREVVI